VTGAKNIVQAIAPTPASTLMKKIKEALQGRDEFDSLTQDVDALLQAAERGGLENDLDDEELDDSSVGDALGTALALANQVGT
jgi:hypothetical protein